MEIRLNGRSRKLACESTINKLIQEEGSPTEGLVVMVNDEIIAREMWDTKNICAEDEVELLCFVSGG